MTKNILIHLEIPFLPNRDPIIFHRWFPLNEDEALVINQGNVAVRLWFDLNCTTLHKEDLPEIERHVNIHATKVYADVDVQGVSDELADFIYEEKDRPSLGPAENPDDRYKRLRREHLELGQQVLDSAIGAFNRLIAFARINKGQYWIEQRLVDYDRMASDLTEFHAKARIEDREWIKWHPTSQVTLRVPALDWAKLITREDWSQAKDFVRGKGRPDLVLELLSNSETLASGGYRRNAIIEAIAALEVAVSRFAESPKLENLIGMGITKRVDADSLKHQVDHLGLQATIRFLLPLLFDERTLPTNLINQCQSAIEIRGNVVHQGQRDVTEETLMPLLKAIRNTCTVLSQFTDSKANRNEISSAA